ncbi:CMGC/CLK protein kinase [Coprinopsis sp. MPI-PUGE-AT-0042]|nr:CMGC/CLK protein kinase [Coprinopsis sp. MPI-PUGE-AT-0042]
MSNKGRRPGCFSVGLWFSTLECGVAWRLFSHIPVRDLARLGETSKALRCAVTSYNTAAWSLQRFLEPWELNPSIFLAKAELTAAIFTGWQALRFAERLVPDPQDGIHIMVRIGGFLALGRHLLDAGYLMESGRGSGDPIERLFHLVFTAATDGRIQSLSCDYESILAVTFVKLTDEPSLQRRILKVYITVTNVDPIDFVIATAECTAIMNIVTPQQLISLYPYETFVSRTSYACHAESTTSLAFLGSAHRSHPNSFQLISAFDWTPPRTIWPGPRHMGDGDCWVQSVNVYELLNSMVYQLCSLLYSPGSMEDYLDEYLPAFAERQKSFYHLGDYIADKYQVCDLYSLNGPAQVLRAKSQTERYFVIKVVKRTVIKADHYLSDLQSITHTRHMEDIFLVFHRVLELAGETYYLFPDEGTSMQWVMDNPTIAPFSPRQVREIVTQITCALDWIHDRFVAHGDLCPENIRFVHSTTISESWYDTEKGYFRDQSALRCTQIKLSYFGELGVDSYLPLHDRYRSPEATAGLEITPKSDHFSLGCLMAELLANEPLFCDCTDSFSYVRDKLWMMESLLGRFPEEVVQPIRSTIPKVFTDRGKVDVEDPIEVSVEEWVDDHDILEAVIRDKEALLVIRTLMEYDPEERLDFRILRQNYDWFLSLY